MLIQQEEQSLGEPKEWFWHLTRFVGVLVGVVVGRGRPWEEYDQVGRASNDDGGE